MFSTKIPCDTENNERQIPSHTSFKDLNSIIVDVRSESEFQKGSIPGARSCPLLSDSDRALVGTTYKREGPKEASQLALEIFATHSETYTEELNQICKNGRVLIYCARGGLRSRFVSKWLGLFKNQKDIEVVPGGYKAYRQDVLRILEKMASHRFLVLNGRTGCGKTAFLRNFRSDLPIIDFEGLANHRGSAFGDFAQTAPTPSPQNFENLIANSYNKLRHHPTIIVEMENFLGPLKLPVTLAKKIRQSPMIYFHRSFCDRVQHIREEYGASWTDTDTTKFEQRVDQHLSKLISKTDITTIKQLVSKGALEEAISILLTQRYDRLYDKSLKRHESHKIAEFDLTYTPQAKIYDFIQRHINQESAGESQ